jgi:DeoR/GlpR family transcriptional regulator of sugar metabolism
MINSETNLILLDGTFQPKLKSVAGSLATVDLNQIFANQTFREMDGKYIDYNFTLPSNSEA